MLFAEGKVINYEPYYELGVAYSGIEVKSNVKRAKRGRKGEGGDV